MTKSLIHATSIARNTHGVLLIGRSGSGKSDLALRLIDRGWELVADDYTELDTKAGTLIASAPPRIAGKMEIRGVGLVEIPYRNEVPITLVADLDTPPDRLPEPLVWRHREVDVPMIRLRAFEASAPLKLEWALAQTGAGER